jgi:predicted nucleotidyltransferase
MKIKNDILLSIKNTVKSVEPSATIIVFGSYARGDNTQNSDIDILILIDKLKLSREDEKRIKYPIYDIEFETGKIISPIVLSRNDWESRHRITPFYKNVTKEGITL